MKDQGDRNPHDLVPTGVRVFPDKVYRRNCKLVRCCASFSAGSRQVLRPIKFSDKNLKKVRYVTYPVFEGVCDEEGVQNLK